MGTSSIVIEQEELQIRKCINKHASKVSRAKPQQDRTRKNLGLRMVSSLLEVTKSVLLVGMLLALYKVSGLHAWWLQLLGIIN